MDLIQVQEKNLKFISRKKSEMNWDMDIPNRNFYLEFEEWIEYLLQFFQ